MSDPAIHENPSTGVLLDQRDLGFDYFFDFVSFLIEASDNDFKIHVESGPFRHNYYHGSPWMPSLPGHWYS